MLNTQPMITLARESYKSETVVRIEFQYNQRADIRFIQAWLGLRAIKPRNVTPTFQNIILKIR